MTFGAPPCGSVDGLLQGTAGAGETLMLAQMPHESTRKVSTKRPTCAASPFALLRHFLDQRLWAGRAEHEDSAVITLVTTASYLSMKGMVETAT